MYKRQDFNDFDIDDHVLEFYERLMSAYLKDRKLIPEENLIETRFEDLTRNPIEELNKIYDQFDLPGKVAGLEKVSDYVEANKDYKKNTHQITEAQVSAITNRWAFAFDEWGYPAEPQGIDLIK